MKISMNLLKKLLLSDVSDIDDLEIFRKTLLIRLIITLGSFFLLFLSILAIIQSNMILALADMIMFSALQALRFRLRRPESLHAVSLAGTVLLGIFYTFLLAFGGVDQSAFVWIFTYPLLALFMLGKRLGSILSMAMLMLTLLVFWLGRQYPFIASYNDNLTYRILSTYLTLFLISLIMEHLRKTVQDRLQENRQKLERANREKEQLIGELQSTLQEIDLLRGILPICACCKKVRNDSGYWEQVEEYIRARSKAQFSHSICPDCAVQYYDEIDNFDHDPSSPSK